MIQSSTKKAINKELSHLNRQMLHAQPHPLTAISDLSRRRTNIFETTPSRQIFTSYFPSQLTRLRDEEDFDCFLLSDLTDQESPPIDRKQISQAHQRKY